MPPKKNDKDTLVAALQKRFGSTSATRLGSGRKAEAQVTEVIPTGIEVVDYYLCGIGGLAIGRVTEMFGEEGCGKTSFDYQVLSAVQRLGGVAVVADPEFSFDEERARLFGVDVDELIVLQPKNLEMLFNQTRMVLEGHNPKKGPMLVSWDTLSACKPAAAAAKEAGDVAVGESARICSEEFPKIIPLLQAHRAHLFVINQIRVKLGVMFGNNTTTAGGNSLKFYASMRMQFFGGKALKDASSGEHTGKVTTLMAVKTRFTPPFRKMRLRLDYATGYNNEWTTLEHAKRFKLIDPRGAKGQPKKGPKAHAYALAKLGWKAGVVDVDTPDPESPVELPAPEKASALRDEEEE